MDRELSIEFRRKRKIKNITIVLCVVFIVIFSLYGFRLLLRPTLKLSKIRTAVAERSFLEASLTASGVVVPEYEQVITSPIRTKIDTIYLNSGDSVVKGQPILKLNKDFITLEYEKLNDQLELLKNQKHQLKLKLNNRLTELHSEHSIKQLQIQYMEAQCEKEQHLYEIGGGSKNSVDQAELNLQIARKELSLLDSQIENQKATLEADLKGLDLQVQIQKGNLEEIKQQMILAETRADRSGIVVWLNDDIGSIVNKGGVIARIADLGSYKIEAKISDIHADKLRVGGDAKIRINDVDLRGTIGSIQPSMDKGIASFIVNLEDKSASVLRPNLRADVYVISSVKENVIKVRDGPFYNGSVNQKIFIVRGDKAVRRIVNIGDANFDFVEILGDVKPGDEIIISSMEKHAHMSEIDIVD